MRTMNLIVLLALLPIIGAAGGGCARNNVQSVQATLSYQPERLPLWSIGPDARELSALTVHDERPEYAQTGQRLGTGDASRAPIEFVGGVEAWAEAALRDLLEEGGVRFAETGERELIVRIEDLRLHERIVVQASYQGRIVLSFELVDADGRSLWSSRTEGEARNWGRPARDINCSETPNHAIYRAAEEALRDAGFAAAMMGSEE